MRTTNTCHAHECDLLFYTLGLGECHQKSPQRQAQTYPIHQRDNHQCQHAALKCKDTPRKQQSTLHLKPAHKMRLQEVSCVGMMMPQMEQAPHREVAKMQIFRHHTGNCLGACTKAGKATCPAVMTRAGSRPSKKTDIFVRENSKAESKNRGPLFLGLFFYL
uniref:Uncharacterized protein n=1 Tax=Eutreptiella gymnastica TaxID=73025 RepID=A0A7S4LK20_9EUGL